ncbi:serine/threonine-protein kinase [Amycolatopsis sp. DSM 110486]|uniref:serine/threonine-protein kinase n=1 Tax=Amycolatopsis sp. DSM 110486 TaxID=2865832 RepID=UPI002103ACF4|nr:serine/threonine-protein kinase [Amycolatopsis sp. DSM 110486]
MTKRVESPDRSPRPAKPPLSALDPTHPAGAGDHGEGHGTECAGRLVAGRYRVESLLARGGMAMIWLAEDEFLRRQVALKQVNVSYRASAQSRRAARVRALREARTAAQVGHPGVVTVYDVVRQDGDPWIVMELLRGRSLAEALDAEGPLRGEQVIHIGLSLLDVLRAVHRANIVHRDVKPANVQLCDGARVILTDFGIAIAPGSDSRTQIRIVAGSPGYVSPERLRGGKAGPASDLFSLGATLFTAVEGTSPFTRDNMAATLAAVTEEPPAPFLRAGPLRPVIEGLLAKEPNRRLNADQAYTVLQSIRRERCRTDLQIR